MASSKRISTLAKQVQNNPEDSFSKFALALELLKIEQVDKARRLFESIYHNDPEYLGVYYHLGKLYVDVSEYELAETMYSEGIERAEHQSDRHTENELQEALQQLHDIQNDV